MPRTLQIAQDPLLLNATLEGLEAQKQRIEEQIRQVKAMLGGGKRGRPPAAASSSSERPRKTRKLSAEARKRIAAAQKRRWAEFRKTNAQS
jgi:hypothetical protein